MLVKISKSGNMALTAARFSETVVDTNLILYARRKQTNRAKIVSQIFSGKIAELGVYLAFTTHNLSVSKPDFQVYEAKEKSYDSDLQLTVGEVVIPIHIKSMEAKTARKYGLSWTFQKGRGGTDAEVFFKKSGGLMTFCEVSEDEENYFVELKFILQLSELQEKKELFKEPVVWQLRNSKRVVYASDLAELGLATPLSVMEDFKNG